MYSLCEFLKYMAGFTGFSFLLDKLSIADGKLNSNVINEEFKSTIL